MDDIIVWPDGYWCYGDELGKVHWRTDSYERVPYGSPRYFNLQRGVQ